MRVLNRSAVAAALSHAECVEALVPAMCAVSDGRTDMPLRQYLNIPRTQGKFTVMPGYLDDPRVFGLKAVAKYPRETDSPLGSHVGAVMIFDADLGVPLALMDGAELTAIRTSAASALATRELAREDAATLAILGCGTQAVHHIHAMLAVRPIRDIHVWGRNAATADAMIASLTLPDHINVARADTAQDAVTNADIVCTTTAARTPILQAQWLAPGTHVNLVGAAIRDAAEADQAIVTDTQFYTDYRPSALAQAGELIDAIEAGVVDETVIVGELGEVLLGRAPDRQNDDDITTYKSLGVAAQDLAAAVHALAAAEKRALGVAVDWLA